MPETRLGKWAGWFLLAGIGLLTLLILAYNTEVLGDVLEQRTVGGLALWVATAISVLGALVTGALSWLKHRDRSLVVILATIYGVLATILLAFGAIPQN
jgi:hypothetical protein